MSPIPFSLLLAAQQGADQGGFFFPPEATDAAARHDWVFFLILWIAGFFFLLINVSAVYFAIKYRRRREGEPVEKSPSHNNTIEIIWTVIPSIIVCYLFWAGLTGYVDRRTPPEDAYTIYVNGQQWSWSFRYPNGTVTDELHAPVDTPIKLVLSASDVIHSLYIPAFRIKMDAVPGRLQSTWFNANMTGDFDLFCAEYCGRNHSAMITRAVISDRATFDKWLADQMDVLSLPPAEAGQKLYTRRGCVACHSLDGSRLVGPTLKDLFGHEVTLEDGSTVVADENYLQESILDPNAKIVKGDPPYPPTMPNFATGPNALKPAEVSALIEFIKTLKD